MSLQRLTLLSLLVLTLAACSTSPAWFRGDWVVDVDRSQKGITDTNPPPPPPATNQSLFGNFTSEVNSMASNVNSSMHTMLLQKMSGMEYVITDKDIAFLDNGQGSSHTYEIVNKTPDSIVIKESDGSVESFSRGDNDSIYITPTGADFRVYFHRKPGS